MRMEGHFLKPIHRSAAFWGAMVFAIVALAGEAQMYTSLPGGEAGQRLVAGTGLAAAAACVVIGLALVVRQHSRVRRILDGREASQTERALLDAALWAVQIFSLLCGAVLFLSWSLTKT